MAKRSGKSGFGWIIAVILCAVVSFAAVFHFTGGFETMSVTNFAIIRNGDYILANRTGLTITKGETLEIKQFDSDEKIEVEIFALRNDASDLSFTYGGKTYTWNEGFVSGDYRDVTDKFDVQVEQSNGGENGSITINGSVRSVLNAYVGDNIEFETSDMRGVFFRMVVTVGAASISLDFDVYVPVEGVDIDTGEYIF